MKLYRAISPSRNDQWSGNTLRVLRRTKLAEPNRSSISFAAWPACCSRVVMASYPRSQKLGPTGPLKSLVAMR